MLIRAEQQKDWPAVYTVNAAAFETSAEARLVDVLREKVRPIVSLVAEEDGVIVGHILFTPVSLSGHPESRILGLGPMAVAPGYQNKGIGSGLVRTGLQKCNELGYGAVIVLGHPGYYPRFGFLPSTQFGIQSEYDVPEEVFMAIELTPDYLRDASGTIKYHSAFAEV